MRVLVDAQLPPALARWLSAQGEQAQHVTDVGLGEASDDDIWRFATEARATIITKDVDFALRAQLQVGGPPVVWVRWGNVRNAELFLRFPAVWHDASLALQCGESLIEVA